MCENWDMNRIGPPDIADVLPADRHPIFNDVAAPRLRTQRAVAGVLLPLATAVLLGVGAVLTLLLPAQAATSSAVPDSA